MIALWLKNLKTPLIGHSVEEVWQLLLKEREKGNVKLPEKLQVWEEEVPFSFFASHEFFPNGFMDEIENSRKRGEHLPTLLLIRGFLMYGALRGRLEKLKSLCRKHLAQEGKEVIQGASFLKDPSDGSYFLVATFYGRYPVFTVQSKISIDLEEDIRALALKRMDSFSKPFLNKYVRWIPEEFSVVSQDGFASDEWSSMPHFQGLFDGENFKKQSAELKSEGGPA